MWLFIFLGQEENAVSEGCQSEESPACNNEGESKNEAAEMIPEETSVGEGLETSCVEAASKEASAGKESTSNVSNSEGESKNETAEMIPEETSMGEGLDTSSVEAASEEASAGKENTSNVSNSSASSDIISGTPQPVSRRQSFITLEKFGAAENRPFSPAPLNSVVELPGSAAGAQENTSGSKASAKAEKSGEENKDPPKPEAEAGVTAIRRVTRRQSRMELQGNKPKLLSRSEESLASDSLESSAELCSAGEDGEHVLLSQSQALHSTEADIKKVEDAIPEVEKAQALDMDSKENTPPDTTSC